MYDLLLILHNLVRWLVLLGALWVLLVSWQGLRARAYGRGPAVAGRAFVGLMDLQLLLGLLLYGMSPLVRASFANFGLAIGASDTRFFLLEHSLAMIVAVALAHLGSIRVRQATGPVAKHRQALLWYGLSLGVILLTIPWWRPLLRF
jgi:hypothetical protein